VLVLLLLLLLLLLALPTVVVPLRSCSQLRHLEDALGIFATCRRTNQCLDVMDQLLQIMRRNQETIHSQQDEPLYEFLNVPVFPARP
jgi:hypothetical protein